MAGFRPARISGNAQRSVAEIYHVDSAHASNLAVGDVVTATGTFNSTNGYPEADAASAGGAITGVIISIMPNPSDVLKNYLPASTAGQILVETSPHFIFECEADAAVVAADSELNMDINATAATVTNSTSAASNMNLDVATKGTGTAQFRFITAKDVDNLAAGDKLYAKINESVRFDTVGV